MQRVIRHLMLSTLEFPKKKVKLYPPINSSVPFSEIIGPRNPLI